MNLKEDIIDFKNELCNQGMCINTYLNKRKDFINKIEIASKRDNNFISILYFKDLISTQQYIDFKNRIDKSKQYYKKLLSFY